MINLGKGGPARKQEEFDVGFDWGDFPEAKLWAP